MIVRPAAELPAEFAVRLGDGQIVDAGDPPAHQAIRVELPILVPIGAKPMTASSPPTRDKPTLRAVLNG